MNGKAYCDGRGNAGTGARAAVLFCEDGRVIEKAEKISPTTNIVAEHLAIQLALLTALEAGITKLIVYNDSQTPVFQVQGTYAVKQEHLRPIVEKTWELGQKFSSVEIQWVPREKTKRPDELCRQVDRPPAARPRPQSRRP